MANRISERSPALEACGTASARVVHRSTCCSRSQVLVNGPSSQSVRQRRLRLGPGRPRADGVTGKKGNGDGSGIDYKAEDGGNEWRWIEQWIPHSGWFLVAASAMAQAPAVQVHRSSDL